VSRVRESAYHLAETYPVDKQDVTSGGIEKPVEKYFAHTGKAEMKPEELFYFILAYNQTVVLVKTGKKDAEKRFLGYEFSDRRRREGIHAIERGSTIEKCTHLFDEHNIENPQKASTYIYRAFSGDITTEIDKSLQGNVSRVRLVDMLVFGRESFDKILTSEKKEKKVAEFRGENIMISKAIINITGKKVEKFNIKQNGKTPVVTQEVDKLIAGYSDADDPVIDLPLVLFGDHTCVFKYINFAFFRGADGTVLLKPNRDFDPKYFYYVLKYLIADSIENKEKYERHFKYLKYMQIPKPIMKKQKEIVAEIESLEEKSKTIVIDDIDGKIKLILKKHLK
jgi:type I restriction enzyme M protein